MNRRNRLAIGLAAGAMLGGVAPVTVADSELLRTEPWLDFGSSFESGGLQDDWKAAGNTPEITTQQKRSGRYALKSYLHRYHSVPNYRTEVRARAPSPVKGEDTWYGFSIYLPGPYARDSTGETLAQWHANEDAGEKPGNPPIALQLKDGNWRLMVRWNASQPTVRSEQQSAGFKLGLQDTNDWTDWVFRIRWSYGNDGELQVWRNGKQVLNRSGPNCFNDKEMPYFKLGIYKSMWKAKATDVVERIVYHDEVRIAGHRANYADVAPR